jgi:hypothetical protein
LGSGWLINIHLSNVNLGKLVVDLFSKLMIRILLLFSVFLRFQFIFGFLSLGRTGTRILAILIKLEEKYLDVLSWESITDGFHGKLEVGPLRAFKIVEDNSSIAILLMDSRLNHLL